MAEILVSEVIKVVIQKLVDESSKKILPAAGIQSEIKNLGKTLSEIQNLLNDAADKETDNEDVKQWFNSLKHLAYDIDDFLDGLATDAMHHELTTTTSKVIRKFIPKKSTDFKVSSRLHSKLDSINTKLHALEKEKSSIGLIIKEDINPISMHSRGNTTSFPDSSTMVGRERGKKELLHKLLGDDHNPCQENFSVVPIVGMGGVGKTTLARSLYNETLVKNHFKLLVWVYVSSEFDGFKISETIFRATTSENKEFKHLTDLQKALSDQLKGKRFLLVLDDIWSEHYVDWENLVKPFHSGAPRSKIIVTTRKLGLLKQIGFDHVEILECLSHDESMSLLARHALDVDNFNSHPTLKPHGDNIVKKCGRLPLALKVVGRLLRANPKEQDWEQVKNSELWHLKNAIDIVPALRLSYHELSACLKQLFAYCSFFPKNYLFDKEELVLLWVAEGFIKQSGFITQSTGSMLSEESLGHKYFEDLLSRSFFQHAPNDKKLFVMHDLLNELATFVAEDFFLRLNDETEIKTETLAKYRHMSFIREEFVEYQKLEPFKSAKSLRTFLAVSIGMKESSDCFYLSNKISVDLLSELPLLRVLCLSGFQISEVPECVGRLKHLRYLNFSQTKIKEIPENVGNLYNLQSLIVFGCDKLCKLPKSFSKLKNLRHLDIRDTPLLKQMPLGIGELNSLQTLSKIIIEGDEGFTITELAKLKNLEGKIRIEGLDKLQDARDARNARLSTKKLIEVELVWSDVSNSRNETLENQVLSELKPCNDALKKFKIVSYSGTKFPNWVGDPSFYELVHVSISDCRNCESLPALGRLQSLKELVIGGMKEVKVIGPELLGTGGVAFPSLEILSFVDMFRWSVWSSNSWVSDDVVFPRLRELNIYNCPVLFSVSLESLPSLRILNINGCRAGVLRRMVRVASSVTQLVINSIRGLSDEVWKGVIKKLRAIEEVRVYGCNEIRYMWESEEEASKFLVNLRCMEVNGCLELVRLGKKQEDYRSNMLTSLRILKLKDCDNLKDCSCPGNIETLELIKCRSITSVSFPTGEGEGGGIEKLKILTIKDCKELVVVGKQELVRYTNNTQMLEYVQIERCPNLKSMNGLLDSIHLTSLIVWDCENMKSFPELPNLTSLAHMAIVNCPSLDSCFPPEYWPPNLTSLLIGGLKKPMSEWGPQNFPTSLVKLGLIGGENDYEERDLNLLFSYHLFPSNLTHLGIGGFDKLETVSVGLQHLTSLQHFRIGACPKLKDVPKKMLPSLLSLDIYECPKLKEKISKNGRGSFHDYWPKVSHIPCIEIDGE